MIGLLCGLIIILAIAIIILIGKILLMQKAIKEITESFNDRLTADTNTLIDISSRDPYISKLALSINEQLRLLRKQRHCYVNGDRELKEAVTNISHDLRTPLTAICGYLDLLDTEEKSPEVERYISIISDRIDNMKILTEELFRYSVVSSERNMVKEQVVINSVLEESIAAFYAIFIEKGIVPKIHIPEDKVIKELDRSALSRVFSNLLSNAVKYSDGDLEIMLSSEGTITFSNKAKELDEVQAAKLFNRFYTVEAARKSTGLGLSIAKVLVEQMGGSITAEYCHQKLTICISF
ncbi:MAG: HAMP domain-containing histidine kinase [Ruminococcus sp.]|nr:HAMP domain-containing histidine kinase [Ruminococcus sp.]